MVTLSKPQLIASHAPAPYPHYMREERWADGLIHCLGIVGSIAGFSYLFAQPQIDAYMLPALVVYSICVIALFCSSAAYHMTPWPSYRPMLRRFDQAAIYFKIAGTYTPLVFLVETTAAFSLLGFIWIVATLGAVAKLVTGDRLDRYTIMIYLGMGWSSVLLLWPLFQALDVALVSLVLAGGVLYTIGVIFHQAENLKYSNAIWHGFVLAASTCHFAAVALAVT